MTTHLGLQRIMIPSAQVSQLTTGSITLPTNTRTALPDAPTIDSVTGGDSSVVVDFTPATTASTATSFIAVSTPDGITGTASNSPITVSGLTNGTSYTFTVAGINAIGTGAPSASSSSVTPAVPAANTPAGYVTATYANLATKKFNFTLQTYSTLSNTARYGDYANADNSPYASYKFGNAGSITGGGNGNGIFKFGFYSETDSVLATTTTYSFFGGGGATNNGVAAYIVGGMTTDGASGLSTSNKMLYSNDTPSLLGTTLANARGAFGGVYNANTAAYFTGGTPNNGTTLYSSISKMLFSTDTLSTIGAILSSGLAINPTTNSTYASTAGFVFGGYIGSGNDTATVAKLTFSSETRSDVANLASASRATSVMSKNDTAGYFNAGTGGTGNTQKMTYNTNTMSTLGVTDDLTYSESSNNQGA